MKGEVRCFLDVETGVGDLVAPVVVMLVGAGMIEVRVTGIVTVWMGVDVVVEGVDLIIGEKLIEVGAEVIVIVQKGFVHGVIAEVEVEVEVEAGVEAEVGAGAEAETEAGVGAGPVAIAAALVMIAAAVLAMIGVAVAAVAAVGVMTDLRGHMTVRNEECLVLMFFLRHWGHPCL